MDADLPDSPDNATAEAVRVLLGRPWRSDAERQMVEALLADAWGNLLDDVPSLESRMQGRPSRLLATAGRVLVAAVTRVAHNPEGWRQVGLDDFQGTRDSILSAGLLTFTDQELARLHPRQALPPAYTVGMGVPYWGES